MVIVFLMVILSTCVLCTCLNALIATNWCGIIDDGLAFAKVALALDCSIKKIGVGSDRVDNAWKKNAASLSRIKRGFVSHAGKRRL